MNRIPYIRTEEHRMKQRLLHLSEKNGMWKGDDAKKSALHLWVKDKLQKPKRCQICKKIPPHDLANISGKYLRDLKDWQWLCRRCHMLSDGRMGNLKQFRTDNR